MFFSSFLTKKAIENRSSSCDGGRSLTLLIVSIVFLVIEITMLYFAIKIALVSGKSSATKFVNVILAITLTLPYLLLSLLFNPDARTALGDAPTLKFACEY